MADRDLYGLLGVSTEASDAEIKKAFRAKARELHPDVNDAPDAQERFRAVAEAYEVISNAETRRLYDLHGEAGLRGGGFTPSDFDLGNLGDIFGAFFGDDLFASNRGGRARGADVGATAEIDLADSLTGAKRTLRIEVAAACERCDGLGAEPGTEPSRCSTCDGQGRVQQVSRSIFGEFVRAQACPSCGGTGQLIESPCTECRGGGRVLREKTVEVEIPAGIHDGQRIRIRGEGHVGPHGGLPGDVFLQVHVVPDPRFERDGNDLLSRIELTIAQAALGATVAVPTIEGETELEIAAGTQPGEVRVLRGKGMPVLQGFGRGDQRVLVDVVVPRRLTDEQRRLLEEFERLSGDETYRPDEGFFEKLKSALR